MIVLIESDWNLKIAALEQRLTIESGINRIRLEFKAQKSAGAYSSGQVLIESDWNLKEHHGRMYLIQQSGINRIRLEFKGNYFVNQSVICQSINRIRLEFKDIRTSNRYGRRTSY